MKIEDDDADEKVELVYVEEEDESAGSGTSIWELHRLVIKKLAEHGRGAKKL